MKPSTASVRSNSNIARKQPILKPSVVPTVNPFVKVETSYNFDLQKEQVIKK
jgi:hypothetical protein